MRVVHVSFHQDPRRRSPGELMRAWPTLFEVARAAAGSDLDVRVIQMHHEQAESSNSVPVTFTPHVLREVEAAGADVVHVHGLGFARSTRALAALLPRTPVLVQDHGGGLPARWRRPLVRWGLRHVRGAAFTASAQAAAYAFALPRAIRVFEVLESSTHFTPGDVATARSQTGLHGDPCIVWIGRFIPSKDPLTALDALRRAARVRPDSMLWCCHFDDSMLAEVQAIVQRDAELQKRVRLLGRVPHERVELLCRAADIYISASRSEGSGYSLIESLACGTTPVVTDIPSFRAITRGGAVGKLVPVCDASAMAQALIDVCDQPSEARRRRAREHFEQHLTFDVIGRDLRRAYEAIAQ